MKNKTFALLLATLVVCVFPALSCSGKHKKDKSPEPIEKGKTCMVACTNDATISYAIYLPTYYDASRKWPVIYAFDPHASGTLPVNLFKEDAEKYGYIIVGSMNSKNGTQWNITSAIYDTLYNDTHARLSIDETRIYTVGFSGGSRVAGNIAITKGGINTVICCGAGIGSVEQSMQKFKFFGIAGKEDMNYNELVAQDSALTKAAYVHYFETFKGKHEWPPKWVAHDAMLWLECKAMKEGQKIKNDTLINNTYARWMKTNTEDSITSNKTFAEYLHYLKILNFFDGLLNNDTIKKINEKVKILESNAAVILAKKHVNYISQKETSLQTYYADQITSQTPDWWKTQVNMINAQGKSTSDYEERCMYKRVLNYLSLVTYMNISSAMKSNLYDVAEKLNIIYALVDPENPEHAYLSATFFMKKGKNAEALNSLEDAVKLGFKEASRLESDTVMTALKSSDKYPKILESIKKNIEK